MKDKYFFDTNIFIYAVLDAQNESEIAKQNIALALIENEAIEVFISIQVLNEVSNILLKKSSFNQNQIISTLEWMLDTLMLIPFTAEITLNAVKIASLYKFSFYDSLIISAAMLADCEYLLTEDLQDQQIISYKSRQIQVINPFKKV
jgi:predicted nucleic acid-binding protein